jgi:hypothetical protein
MKAFATRQFTGNSRSSAAPRVEEMVRIDRLAAQPLAPLVIQSVSPDVDLAGWAAANRDFIDRECLSQGAILFRGFGSQESDVGAFPRSVWPNDPVWLTSPAPNAPEKDMLWHHDIILPNEFGHCRWPARVMFNAIRLADWGGQTIIADARKVLRSIDPAILREFAKRKLRYVRNYWNELGRAWQRDLGVDNRDGVADYCRANDIEHEWVDGQRLRLRWIRPAIQVHPRTGEAMWFNHLHNWHEGRYEPHERQSLLDSFRPEDRPMNCSWGDGSPIESSIVSEVIAAYREFEICFDWKPNDVMLIYHRDTEPLLSNVRF